MIVAYSRLFIMSYFSTYSGSFNIPVTCLLSPDKEYMVREADEKFMECLNHEMLENKTCGVAPIVATVRLSDDEQFDMKHSEAYTYDTIGGNHSRIALQQLIKEPGTGKGSNIFVSPSLCIWKIVS